jgi:hypothetical protein
VSPGPDFDPDGQLMLVDYGPGSEGLPDSVHVYSNDAAISLHTADERFEVPGGTVAELNIWLQNREANGEPWRVTVELTLHDMLTIIGAMVNEIAPHLKATPDSVRQSIEELPGGQS